MATITEKYRIMKLSQAEYKTLTTPPDYTLIKDGVTYTYSPEDTIYVTPDEPMVFTNVSPVFTDQSSDPDIGYENYIYKGVISNLEGVTSDLVATVIFNESQALSGNYSATCITGEETVTIYAKDNTSIVIPIIVIGSPRVILFDNAEIDEAMDEILGGNTNE